MLDEAVQREMSNIKAALEAMRADEYSEDHGAEKMHGLDDACTAYLRARNHAATWQMNARLPLGEGNRQECDWDQENPERSPVRHLSVAAE